MDGSACHLRRQRPAPESLGLPHPTCAQMPPTRHFHTLKQSWTQSTPLIWGLELKTPSLQRRRYWCERGWGPDPLPSLAAVAKLISVIGPEVSIAPQVQL